MNNFRNNTQRHRCARYRSAFTLVELLVVVSIIALLISILLPSLRCAREQTKSAVCIANLKGIATASLTYASDDETEASIPIHEAIFRPNLEPDERRLLAAHVWGGKSGRGKEGDNLYFWGTFTGRGPAGRPLNKFLYKSGFTDYRLNAGTAAANWKKDENLDLGLFRCPSDTGYKGIHWKSWKDSGLTSYDHYGNSYACNILWVFSGGPNWKGCIEPPCCKSLSPILRPLSRIPNPSNTLYYEENVGRYTFWAEPQGKGACGATPFPNIIVGGWHPCRGQGGKGDWTYNVSFADAHAGAVRMKGHQSPELSHYPTCGGRPPEQCYEFWQCVITRGPGYQRDTLPSPEVQTTLPCSTAREDVD
ncbi:MAG: prepilin-type N-terminal cleavage/methylation domain-containing protein [bacterium]|nr:prepilin-type N-terminal cleavage/methylation domain-containing protein [bacterium]